MTDVQKIKVRIQALIAKATSTTNEHEASAFMAKAQELLEEYQIDLGELQDADDPVKVFKGGPEMTDKDPSWIKHLYSATAGLYGCQVLYNAMVVRGKMGYRIEITGRESAIVTTELMFPWIKKECYAAGRRLAKQFPQTLSPQQYARRVGNALVMRIRRLTVDNKVQPKTEAAARNALITIDRVEQVFNAEYAGQDLVNVRDSKVRTTEAARLAAEAIGLHRQATGSSTLQIEGK